MQIGLIRYLIDKLYNANILDKDEIVYILKNIKDENKEILFDYAVKTCERYYKRKVYLRGLIEFSNICMRNCLYCGIRAENSNAERYRLSKDEILECCKEGYSLGYRTFVLQSGEDMWFDAEKISDIIKSIKALYPDVAVTLSIGERTYDEYKIMFDAGADRFLLRHETASEELYGKLHPGASFINRKNCLYILKEIGYQVGAGFMIGLPGQTEEHLADDLIFLKELYPHMIGIGPFIPHSETPLCNEKGGTVEDTLVVLAMARLMVPDALIPATTAIGTLKKNGRELALNAGANVVMPNLTPVNQRAKYDLYENKICIGDEPAHCRVCIENRIRAAGFEPDLGRGDNVNFLKD